jgi:hypothetical protein
MDVAVQNANREGAVLVLFLFFLLKGTRQQKKAARAEETKLQKPTSRDGEPEPTSC